MYFLGQAGNYRAHDILCHTFAIGLPGDTSRLREHLAARYDTDFPHTAVYHTGRSALSAAVKAVVPKDSKVIITSLTCYAVVQAIKSAGCVPVFADASPDTLHFGPRELKKTLKSYPDTRAIIVQNNLGRPVDMAALEQIARKHNLKIIEDLAHCAGVSYPDGRECGTVGDATILSFGKGKSVDVIAGGALVLRDTTLAPCKQPRKRPRLSDSLRERFYPLFGASIRGLYHFSLKKHNLGRVLTAFLLKIRFIEKSADAELSFVRRATLWQSRRALKILKNLPKNRPPMRDFRLVTDREKVLKELEKQGYIFQDTWYDCPVSPERYYKKVHFPEDECPQAVKLSQEIVNIPTWYNRDDLRNAYAVIKKYEKEGAHD